MLTPLIAGIFWGMCRRAIFAWYAIRVAQYGGELDLISYVPFAVSASFSDDPRNLAPVLLGLSQWDAVTLLEIGDVDDDELGIIAAFRSLDTLVIDSSLVPGDGWAKLAQLSALRKLTVHYTKMTPALAKAVGELTRLEVFEFYGWGELPADGLGFLKGLQQLKSVQFIQRTLGRPLGKGDLDVLASLPQLRFLEIVNTPLASGSLAELGSARKLEYLEISNAPINANDLAPIAALPKLLSLNLTNAAITNDALATLQRSRSIELLDISSNPVDSKGLESLHGIPSLKSIYVGVPLYDDAKRMFPGLEVH